MCVAALNSKTCAELEIISKDTMVIGPTTRPRACRRRSSASSISSSSTSKRAKRTYVEHNYCDHFDDPMYQPGESEEEDTDAPKRRGPRGGVVVPFPERLYTMLNQVEEDGFEDVVSWQPHGRCFIVHEPKRFVTEVMPKYFRQSKLTSFQRQVNLYGFRRLTAGKDRGAYYHEMFLRGRPDLHKRLVRIRVKGTGFKSASSPATEPNFYIYPFCTEEGAKNLRTSREVSDEEMPPVEPTIEPLTISSFPPLDIPMDPSWKPLSAPPKMMVVTPQLKGTEGPALTDFNDFKPIEEEAWTFKSSMSLSSMAKDIATFESPRHSSPNHQEAPVPTPITPDSNVRQLVSTGLEQALAMVSPVDSPSPSPFPSMLSLQDAASKRQAVPTPLPDLIDSRMDTFQEGIQALLSADFADFDVDHNELVDGAEAPSEYTLDPLFLLEDVVV